MLISRPSKKRSTLPARHGPRAGCRNGRKNRDAPRTQWLGDFGYEPTETLRNPTRVPAIAKSGDFGFVGAELRMAFRHKPKNRTGLIFLCGRYTLSRLLFSRFHVKLSRT